VHGCQAGTKRPVLHAKRILLVSPTHVPVGPTLQENPEVVFNGRGEREHALSAAALDMVAAFEELLDFLVQPAAAVVR
jgi:hypothetical protein